MEEKCARCQKQASQKCAACNRVFYCSREHQKLDWKTHRQNCIPIKIDKCETIGRYVRAIRSISEGEIIIKESPLVYGPSFATSPVCLGCLELITEEKTSIQCPQCGWPFCTDKCLKEKIHQLECELIQSYRGEKVKISNFGIEHPLYQAIVVLRCLALKEKDKNKWNPLEQLEDHRKYREGTSNIEKEKTTLVQLIRNFFKMSMISEDEILRITGIIHVNGHEVPTTEPAHVAIYEMTSFLEHSCRPNCSKSFTSNGMVLIRSVMPIAKGDHLSICYTDALWGTTNRRHHLSTTKFFWCKCQRCADPTELGTHFSSLCCTQNCGGYLVPLDPLIEDLEQDALIQNRPRAFQCHKCSHCISSYEAFSLLEGIGEKLVEIGKKDAESCERFLLECKNKLHPNHYFIIDVKIALAQMLGQENGLNGLSMENLLKKKELCQEILTLIEKLVPAESRLRGVLQFELHAVFAEEGRRKYKDNEINPDEFKNMLLNSRRFLLNAYELLRYEADILPEGKIALQARKNIMELDLLIRGHQELQERMNKVILN